MAKKMLVVVDYQNDFVDGALGFPGAEKLDHGIAQKIKEFAERGDHVVVTLDTHYDNYLDTREGKALPVPHCIEGTHGHRLYGETAKMIETMAAQGKCWAAILEKETFGSNPEDMAEMLPDEVDTIDTIEFVGLVTNMCVLANVCCFQAMYPDAQIIVHANLCDSFDKELHNKTLDVLRGMQVEVRED